MTGNACRVYAVRSLEEAKHIFSLLESKDFKHRLFRLFISLQVLAANFALRLLGLILFKTREYKTREFSNIVAYTVGIVGDNVVMLPALAALRRRYPRAKITVVTNCQMWDQEAARGVLQPSPYKDRLIILGEDPVQRNGFRFILNERLTNVSCDLFVNLSPFGNRGWIGAVAREMIFAKKLGSTHAVGYKFHSLSRRGKFNSLHHLFVNNEPSRSRDVLRALGIAPVTNEDLFPRLVEVRRTLLKKIGEKVRDAESFFIMNPGAKFSSKCWPVDRFGEVSRWLHNQYRCYVIITGTPEERSLGDAVVAAAGEYAINLAGETTIQELVELLRLSKGCVTNDTGTMHISAMVGVPTVALFTLRHSPVHWLPAGRNVISLFSEIDCIYCYSDDCKKPACLEGIRVEDVTHALQDILFDLNNGETQSLSTTKTF